MSTSLGVTIACAGRDDLLTECLASLGGFHGPVVVVCDGWKPAENAVWLKRPTDIILTGTPGHPAGISKAWNAGIRMVLDADCDLVCVQNDDTWLPPKWADEYTRLFAEHPEVLCACAVDRNVAASVFPDFIPWTYAEAWQRLPPGRVAIESMKYYGAASFDTFAYDWCTYGRIERIPDFLPCRMNGASFTLSRKCVEDNGLFDEGFAPPGTSEDYDYWMRLLWRYGPQVMGMATRLFVHHYRSATLSALGRSATESAAAGNNELFRARWCRNGASKAIFEWLAGEGGSPGAQALPWDADVPPFPAQPQVSA